MVRTVARGYSEFGIGDEAGESLKYAPGDTVVGYVYRKTPLVSPSATIKITLCGRTKGSLSIPRLTTYTIGKIPLTDEAALAKTILEGPIHVAPGDAAHKWRFAIDIPMNVRVKRLGINIPMLHHDCLEDCDAVTNASHRLPGSFDSNIPGLSSFREAYVEYFILAHINYTQGGTRHSEEVVFSITLVDVHSGPPISDFTLTRSKIALSVASFKLLPSVKDTGLTFAQRRRQLLRSSKVPQIGGRMEIVLPRTLQLDNPSKVPITLRFVPEAESTSSDMRGIPVQVELLRMVMTIYSILKIHIHIPDALMANLPPDDDTGTKVVLWPPPRDGATEPLYIPCTDEWPAVDVGERIGFRTRLIQRVSKFERGILLAPDFETLNMRVTHRLKFEMEIGIADERTTVKLQSPIVILPASREVVAQTIPAGQGSSVNQAEAPPPAFQPSSESWIHPPADTEAPPTFEEAQKG